MPIRAVLFDKAGTLVDLTETLAPVFDSVLRELAAGDPVRLQRLAAAAGFDLAATRILPHAPVGRETPAELARRFAPVLGLGDDPAFPARLSALAAEASRRFIKAAPGALRVVPRLRAAGLRIGVSTNTAAGHAREDLERLGLLAHVDFVAGFNSGFGAKPEPGHVLAFARAVEVQPEEIACVGDNVVDLQAARAAGALAIGVLGGATSADELAPHADHVVGTLDELPPLVGLSG
jgi:phosphoglycolate phosphatase